MLCLGPLTKLSTHCRGNVSPAFALSLLSLSERDSFAWAFTSIQIRLRTLLGISLQVRRRENRNLTTLSLSWLLWNTHSTITTQIDYPCAFLHAVFIFVMEQNIIQAQNSLLEHHQCRCFSEIVLSLRDKLSVNNPVWKTQMRGIILEMHKNAIFRDIYMQCLLQFSYLVWMCHVNEAGIPWRIQR